MPGTEAIVGIFGQIDRAVQLDPLARLRVSQLLPEYQTRGVRWYDEFLKWQDETRRAPSGGGPRISETAFPGVTEALDAFTAEDLAEGGGRVRARLMFATAVAARAFPQMEDPGSELSSRAVGALTKFAPEVDGPLARDLLQLLAADRPAGFPIGAIPGTSHWWEALLEFLRGRGVDTKGMEHKPCSARLVTVPGIDGPAAALQTEFDTEALTFKQATNSLEPVNWKTCREDFWCRMEEEHDQKLAPGQRRYHEIVSSNCDDETGAMFRAETRLLFNFMWIPTSRNPQAAVTNYELAEQPPRRNDLIQVDEGSLVVSRLNWRPGKDGRSNAGREMLRITTTKRIKFNYPFSSQALALIVCALGWLDTGAQLVACAAAKGKGYVGGPFPGEPANAAMKPRGARGERVAGSSGGPAVSPGGLFEEGADIGVRFLRDVAGAVERNLGGGREGPQKTPPRSGS